MVIYLTPLIPLSLRRRGGIGFRRGANAPLKHPSYWFLLKNRGGSSFYEGLRPSLTYTPLPLLREGGQAGSQKNL